MDSIMSKPCEFQQDQKELFVSSLMGYNKKCPNITNWRQEMFANQFGYPEVINDL